MGIFNLFDPILNFILGPILKTPTVIGLFIISLIITIIITVIYKYTTDQELLKSIREKQKKLQEEMKKHRDNPKKVMKLQKETFSHSGEMMKESFKSMIYTFIPIIILFGWISTHFAFMPLETNKEFDVTITLGKNSTGEIKAETQPGIILLSDQIINVDGKKEVIFKYKAEKEGEYDLSFIHNYQQSTKKIVVGDVDLEIKDEKMKKGIIDFMYGSNEGYIEDKSIQSIKVGYDRIKPFGNFGFFGWHPEWLGTYIIFSLILSIIVRKLMNVY